MTKRHSAVASAGIILLAAVALPLVGASVAGRDLRVIFTFPPPLAIPSDYPHFSWIAVILVAAPFAALTAVWWHRKNDLTRQESAPAQPRAKLEPGKTPLFPLWGWAALAWTGMWWMLAWTRLRVFAPLQLYTFFPLWLGFIVTVNALAERWRGPCLLRRAPGAWMVLFGSSAAFWWVFEWLNRFSHNWHYLGVSVFGPASYAVHATVCFSTVLPAVTAVAELLSGLPRWRQACSSGPALRWLANRPVGYVLLVAGSIALAGTGAAPERFYPALWAAPLALFLGDAIIARRDPLPFEVARGDWNRAATWCVAALACGFFWELWNGQSAAKWIYTVPYVDRWHVFEMPLLGYTGYLPFGLECYFVVTRVLGTDPLCSSASST